MGGYRTAESTKPLGIYKASYLPLTFSKKNPLIHSHYRHKISIKVASPGGIVMVRLSKGDSIRKVTDTLANGIVELLLPALSAGTWRIVTVYTGDEHYQATESKAIELVILE